MTHAKPQPRTIASSSTPALVRALFAGAAMAAAAGIASLAIRLGTQVRVTASPLEGLEMGHAFAAGTILLAALATGLLVTAVRALPEGR